LDARGDKTDARGVAARHTHAMSEETEDVTHMRIRVEGFVQAVGYRNYVIAEATRLGLDGWVRNRADGTVEVLASGPTKAFEALVALCMRGPPGSTVKNIELHSAEAPAEKGFKRRPSL
jgi:acylphosphatase